MQNFIDETGNRHDRLVVIKRSKIKNGNYTGSTWLCKCDCGKEVTVQGNSLRQGNRKYCGHGCKYKNEKHIKHGLSHVPEYTAWKGMIYRCYKPKNKRYNDWGGRGISVVEKWRDTNNGFINFLNYIGYRPSKEHSIDRINPNGNYEPGNVRWATKTEQAINRRKYCVLSKFTIKELIEEFKDRGVKCL